MISLWGTPRFALRPPGPSRMRSSPGAVSVEGAVEGALLGSAGHRLPIDYQWHSPGPSPRRAVVLPHGPPPLSPTPPSPRSRPPGASWGRPAGDRNPPALARPGRPGPPGPRRAAAGPGPGRGHRALGGRHPLLLLPPAVHRRRALKEGRLPIWEPGVFGATLRRRRGGDALPPHLLALRFLPPPARWWPCAWRASTSPGPSPTPSCAPPGPRTGPSWRAWASCSPGSWWPRWCTRTWTGA